MTGYVSRVGDPLPKMFPSSDHITATNNSLLVPGNETLEEKKARQRKAFEARALKRRLELFDEALQCVIAFEEALAYPSWTVEPSMIFPTRFGQEVYIVGDCPQLGKWDVNRAIRLDWGPGGLWSCVIHIPGRISAIEYKYIIIDTANGGIENPQWEWGRNHRISKREHRDTRRTGGTTRSKKPHRGAGYSADGDQLKEPSTNQDGLFPARLWICERDFWGGGAFGDENGSVKEMK